ncbi:MAG: hypothetical protein M1840_002895 [Geoglossum simile]|nr:MAG: hypothetical protein M1840_002895 [Geoglossum simile]
MTLGVSGWAATIASEADVANTLAWVASPSFGSDNDATYDGFTNYSRLLMEDGLAKGSAKEEDLSDFLGGEELTLSDSNFDANADEVVYTGVDLSGAASPGGVLPIA